MTIYTWLTIGGASVLVLAWLITTIFQNVWGGWKHETDTKRKLTVEQQMEKLKEKHYE